MEIWHSLVSGIILIDVQVLIVPIIILILALAIVGIAYLLKRGKTAEAISLLNTFLILLVIVLVLLPIS